MSSGLRLRQLAILVSDLGAATKEATQLFGVEPAFSDPAIAGFGMEHVVMPIGGTFLELLAPIEGVDSAGARYFKRRGGDTMYMVILHATDAFSHRERLTGDGVRIVHEVVRAPNIALHIHPSDAGGVLLDINGDMRTGNLLEEYAPWPHCGDDWQQYMNQDLVSSICGVNLESNDPTRQARTWARLLDVPIVDGEEGVPAINLDVGVIRFVQTGERGPGIAGFDVSTSAPELLRSHLKHLGHSVVDDSFEVFGSHIRFVNR